MIIVWFCWRKFNDNTMKQISLIILLVLSTPNLLHSQYILETNKNWNKYSKVKIKYHNSNQSILYHLKDGKPDVIEIFENDSVISTTKNIILTEEKDTINNRYFSDGRIMSDDDFNYFYNDKKQLIAKQGLITKPLYNIHYQYNKKGLISKQFEKSFNGSLGYFAGNMDSFKYDKCNNIIIHKTKTIKLKSKDTSLEDYDFKDAIVLKYKYAYNKDCLWIRKYFIDKEQKKTLQSERSIE